PACTQKIGNLLSDLPIRLASLKRFQHLIKPLNAPLRTGEGAFFFETWRARQNHVGIAAGVAEENVLYDKEAELGECICDIVGVRVHDAHILADEIHRFRLPLMNGLHHLVVVESLGGGKCYLPGFFKPRPDFWIIYRLVSSQAVGHGSVVTRTLDVVVT